LFVLFESASSLRSSVSLKEAIYKDAHPLLCQYVGFQEAEVTPHADGTATCVWLLESQAHKRLGHLTAHWRKLEDDGFFLTSASVCDLAADSDLCEL
jgi:4'-phosphopantetheinyl transferase EntD